MSGDDYYDDDQCDDYGDDGDDGDGGDHGDHDFYDDEYENFGRIGDGEQVMVNKRW